MYVEFRMSNVCQEQRKLGQGMLATLLTTIPDLHPVHPENPVHPVDSSRRDGPERPRAANLLFKAQSARGAMPARLNIVRWLQPHKATARKGYPRGKPQSKIKDELRRVGLCPSVVRLRIFE